MRSSIKMAAMAFILSTGLLAFKSFEQPANFTGTWTLNFEQSKAGDAPLPKGGKSTIRIIQQKPTIIMEKSATDSAGKVHTATDTIHFDGKVQYLNTGQPQQVQRTMSQQWSADQQVMTLLSKYTVATEDGDPIAFNGTETWKLSADGKVLTITNETVLPDRTEKVVLVYNKL